MLNNLCVINGFLLAGALLLAPVSSICHALALSGGGTKGAYEMGALSALVDNLPADEVKWSVVSGISAGSINTIGISIFAVGDEKNMTDTLLPVWSGLKSNQLFQEWPKGTSPLKQTGILDTSPLRTTIESIVGNPPALADRKIVIGSSSLNTGRFQTWTEADKDHLIEAVMCSSAIPGVFPTQTVSYLKDTFSDGGDILGVNVFDAVRRCQETEKNDEDIVVDIITTWGDTFDVVDASKYTAAEVITRNHDLASYLKSNSAIEDAKVAYPNVNWRYNIAPTAKLPGSDMDFKPEDVSKTIEMGKSDALAAIKKGDIN